MSVPSMKVAIITGSSRGIGAEVALRLAEDGLRIVVNYVGDGVAAEKVVEMIKCEGGQAIAVRADIADPASVAALFQSAESAFGGVDAVINSAGVLPLARIDACDDATFDRAMAINVRGTFNVSREAARRLRLGGRIVNLSSSVIGLRLPTYGVYIATKAAVEGLTQVLAQELRGREICVNAVAPGPVATELFLEGKSPDLIRHLASLNPMERLGQTKDIASVISFLVGPEGGWINGQVIRTNGGMC